DLRKEIRSLIWKAFVESRLKSLRKREGKRQSLVKEWEELLGEDWEDVLESREFWEKRVWKPIREEIGRIEKIGKLFESKANEFWKRHLEEVDDVRDIPTLVNFITDVCNWIDNALENVIPEISRILTSSKEDLEILKTQLEGLEESLQEGRKGK
ncbi:MAG: hypothetical protein QXV20_03865, partial [Candidatus Hadarchaeales archaeon]